MKTLERTTVSPKTESLHKSTYPDHWERYEFASNFVVGKKVLDIACGPGYGTALLSKRAGQTALGLDIDQDVVETAIKNYGHLAIFKSADGYNWPVDPNSIDIVVSLETFEHLDDPDAFLKEANRVLKKSGLLIISTPCNETDTRFKPINPFHLREYNWQEMGNYISKYFTIEQRYSQVSKIGNINAKINNSPLASVKSRIPKSIKNALTKLLTRTSLKEGKIFEGYKNNLSVQLLIASKNT